jgi:hypothetical protein
MSIGKNMMLINSAFKNVKSFSLISIDKNCPYIEAMFDPASQVLAVITKEKKSNFHMIAKLNSEGAPQGTKKQRVQIETFSEYYITDEKDIQNFVEIFAINNNNFEYKKHIKNINDVQVSSIITPA